jgi:hypothetical protein
VPVILGIAAAHEIGPLLLGSNSHSPLGLMRPGGVARTCRMAPARAIFFSRQNRPRLCEPVCSAGETISTNSFR